MFRKAVRSNLDGLVRDWRWPKTVTAEELVLLETMLDNFVELLEKLASKDEEEGGAT